MASSETCSSGWPASVNNAFAASWSESPRRIRPAKPLAAKIHKYGFTLKGASVVLFASEELRARSLFRFTDWPRGLYATDSFSGTRSGGPVAAAWAVMRYLGYEGYVDLNRRIMRMRDNLISGLQDLDCELVGKPELSLIAVRPRHADLAAVSDEMAKHGWILNLLLALVDKG